MNNNKQSSVDYLNDELASLNFDYLTGQIDNKEFNERHKSILEQAKAMHKQEHRKTYNQLMLSNFQTFEHYYEQTFGE